MLSQNQSLSSPLTLHVADAHDVVGLEVEGLIPEGGDDGASPRLKESLRSTINVQANLEENPPFHLHNKPHQMSSENRPHHNHDTRQRFRE